MDPVHWTAAACMDNVRVRRLCTGVSPRPATFQGQTPDLRMLQVCIQCTHVSYTYTDSLMPSCSYLGVPRIYMRATTRSPNLPRNPQRLGARTSREAAELGSMGALGTWIHMDVHGGQVHRMCTGLYAWRSTYRGYAYPYVYTCPKLAILEIRG